MTYNERGRTTLDYMMGIKTINPTSRSFPHNTNYVYSVKCRHCGTWKAKKTKNISSVRFRCPKCNKLSKLKLSSSYGFNPDYRKCKTLEESEEHCKKVNEENK